MAEYQITENCYLLPTPAGAFYATADHSDEPARRLLLALISAEQSPLLSVPQLCKWTGIKNQEDVLELLYRVQKLGWIQGDDQPRQAPAGTLERTLPEMLAGFCSSGKALLADNMGFYLACHGFSHETAEELSALSADLSSLYKRHQGLLKNNLGQNSAAWAIVDAAGNGQLGFWPLHIGRQRFVLVLSGVPQLNQFNFVEMIWALSKRYNILRHSNVSRFQLETG